MKAINKSQLISPDEMREVLRTFIREKARGSLVVAADLLCSDQSHLSRILSGERTVGEDISARLGFQKVKQKKTMTVVFYVKH